MEVKQHPGPAYVANELVKQFYVILNQLPENLHRFYQERSLQGWAAADGVVTPVTTLNGIKKRVMSSDYKYCSVEVKTTDAQESMEGGVIVAVTGFLTRKDKVKKKFSQTFFLAKQEKGFFVLNDILRVFDVSESVTEAAADSAPRDACDSSTGLNFKAAIKNGKVEEASNLVNGATPAASTPSVVPSGPNGATPDAPVANGKASLAVKPATTENFPKLVAPTLPNVNPKITYASVLLRESPVISPRAAAVAPKKQAVAAPAAKQSSPRGDVSTAPNSGVPSSSKFVPRGGQGVPSTSAHAELKGIYIGGLPYDISKQGVADVVKQFGQVRRHSETVQIRRHEDGFCCGFVEFESAESARRAVETHRVMFGEKEAYIMYKRPYNRANNGRARSPTRRLPRNGNSGATENGDWTNYSQRQRQASASRDRLK